jgi:hypothetical protein
MSRIAMIVVSAQQIGVQKNSLLRLCLELAGIRGQLWQVAATA